MYNEALLDIASSQSGILAIPYEAEQESLIHQDIADTLFLSKVNASKLPHRLVRKGLINIKAKEKRLISLTAKGVAIIPAIQAVDQEISRIINESLSLVLQADKDLGRTI